MALVEIRGLAKHFGDNRVLESVDLDVREGEVITVIGPSGSGKTVLLKCLIGLFRLDGGTLRFQDRELQDLSEPEWTPIRRDIGMSFQEYALFDSMTVGDNVAYGLREQRVAEPEVQTRISEALEAVGLGGIEHMRPKELSGGMKKRVGLARAMALRPKVMIYDEPTEGLDPINVTRVNRLLLSLRVRFGVTSIVVTHNMASTFAISDRIALLHEGRIAVVGSPDELRRSTDPRLEHYVRASKMKLPTPSQIPPAP